MDTERWTSQTHRVEDCVTVKCLFVCLIEDSNMERQQAVSMKISKYLLKADDLYQTHLTGSIGEQVALNRWGVSSLSLRFGAVITY